MQTVEEPVRRLPPPVLLIALLAGCGSTSPSDQVTGPPTTPRPSVTASTAVASPTESVADAPSSTATASRPPIIPAVEAFAEPPTSSTSIDAVAAEVEAFYAASTGRTDVENARIDGELSEAAAARVVRNCEVGTPESVSANSKIATRISECWVGAASFYAIYQRTGLKPALELARLFYWHGRSTLEGFKSYTDPIIARLNP